MTTYREIQNYIKNKHQITIKTCWIAHAKELLGLPVNLSHRRSEEQKRVYPFPDNKLAIIKAAFEYFGDL